MFNFSWRRLWAVIVKEFIQMRRDRGTFALILMLPLVELTLFGFAINADPKHLPTALLAADNSSYTQAFIQSMRNSSYFDFTTIAKNEADADEMLKTGKVLFVLTIPTNFTRDLLRGYRPSILLEADATDPAATSNAVASMAVLAQTALNYDLQGPFNFITNSNTSRVFTNNQILNVGNAPINLVVHPRYNPAAITAYNIVPGLVGLILTMTMVVITSAAITRERERGTMENLLATPAEPIEVMIGKVTPYVMVGYIQMTIILVAGIVLFSLPIKGNLLLLYVVAFAFIAANLSVGLLMSTIAKTQLQATQMAVFFFLPSILLSGFMFPFAGMPRWAQYIGQVLPLTHFVRIIRGIILKGNGFMEIWPNVWPILVFLMAMILFGVNRYRKTLD